MKARTTSARVEAEAFMGVTAVTDRRTGSRLASLCAGVSVTLRSSGRKKMKIHRVMSVRVYSLPLVFVKTWMVVAIGQTRSLGWTNPRLVQDKDENGLATFSFEADKPSGASIPVLAPVFVSTLFQPGDDVSGVRVEAETNAITAMADILRATEAGEVADFIPFESGGDGEPFDADSYEEGSAGKALADKLLERTASRCDRKDLLKVPTRVEFKTRGWRLYRRTRYNVTALEYCYPTDLGDEAERASAATGKGGLADAPKVGRRTSERE
jgi:hypothetical protein